MSYKFVPFGFVIGGPHDIAFVSELDEVEAAIEKMMERDNEDHPSDFPFDSDDYTSTAVYALGWHGSIEAMKPFATIDQINDYIEDMP